MYIYDCIAIRSNVLYVYVCRQWHPLVASLFSDCGWMKCKCLIQPMQSMQSVAQKKDVVPINLVFGFNMYNYT